MSEVTSPAGTSSPSTATPSKTSVPDHRKPCTLCGRLQDVRIRCQIDETGTWHFVCPGKCWRQVSGGVVDGDGDEAHRFYRYGGVWKNKHDAVSGKKPKPKKKKTTTITAQTTSDDADDANSEGEAGEWSGEQKKYTKNDRCFCEGEVWLCRKSHVSAAEKTPSKCPNLWKEAVAWRAE